MAALALTGKVAPYSKGMGLMSANVFRAEFPCALHGVSDDDAMASIERIFKNDAEPSDIAAIILEPVQGEGGFYAASPAFMQRLRALCDREGIMLIADELILQPLPNPLLVVFHCQGLLDARRSWMPLALVA